MPQEERGSNTKCLYLLPFVTRLHIHSILKCFAQQQQQQLSLGDLIYSSYFVPLSLDCSVCAAALFLIMSSINSTAQVTEISTVPSSSLSSVKINAVDY